MSRRPFLLLLGLLALPRAPAAAQVEEEVDRIVAVVGTSVVLWSQVVVELSQQGLNFAEIASRPEGRAIIEHALQELINDELLVQAAMRDTAIQVTDEEVAQAVDARFQALRRQIPSEAQFREEVRRSGFNTVEDYRRWSTEQQRRLFLRERYVQLLQQEKKLQPVQPTDEEMRETFREWLATIPPAQRQRPALVDLKQIVVSPKPGAEARAVARARADSIVRELRAGADFETAARRFSQDPGSRDQGGNLGWFSRGQMVPEFDREVFRLRPGVVSEPVETQFGYHIIQVTRVAPTEVQARHILIVPEITQAEADSTRALAERVLAAVRSGGSIDSLQFLYYSPDYQKDLAEVPADSLGAYGPELVNADSGAVVMVPLPQEPAVRTRYAIIVVTGRRQAGELSFKDMRDRIRNQLSRELSLRRLAERLRARTYVETRPLPL